MERSIRATVVALACLAGVWAAPAAAHGWHGGHRSGVFLGFGLGYGGFGYPGGFHPGPFYGPFGPYGAPYYVPHVVPAPVYVVPQAPVGPPAYVAPPAYRGPLDQPGQPGQPGQPVQPGQPGQPAAPTGALPASFPVTCQSAAVGEQLGRLPAASRASEPAAAAGGSILGALLAGELGRQVDVREQACIAQALELAPPGQRVTWEGLHAPARFTVVAGTVEQRGRQHCRSFETEIAAGGDAPRKTFGTACRRPDGVWLNAG